MIKNWKYSHENREILEKVIQKDFPELKEKFKVDFENDDILNVSLEYADADAENSMLKSFYTRLIIDRSKEHPFLYILESKSYSFARKKDVEAYIQKENNDLKKQ